MKLYKLTKKAILLKGNINKLLNGTTANTLDAPRNAFIDINGKIIATFEQKKIGDDEIIILVEEKFVGRLLKHLEKYVLLAKTKIEITDYKVYFDLEEDFPAGENDYLIPYKKGQLIITKKEPLANVSDEEFTQFRLENKIPIQGIDYDNEMLLNLDDYEIVSFTKGCFLGQEIVARVHNLGKQPKRLAVKYEDEISEAEKKSMTSKWKDIDGRVKGFVFVRN